MARSSRRSKASGLPHLVVGLVLGLAVAAGVYFSDLRSGAGLPEAVDRVLRSPAGGGAGAEDAPAPRASAQSPDRARANESSGGAAAASRPAGDGTENRASSGGAAAASSARASSA